MFTSFIAVASYSASSRSKKRFRVWVGVFAASQVLNLDELSDAMLVASGKAVSAFSEFGISLRPPWDLQ